MAAANHGHIARAQFCKSIHLVQSILDANCSGEEPSEHINSLCVKEMKDMDILTPFSVRKTQLK